MPLAIPIGRIEWPGGSIPYTRRDRSWHAKMVIGETSGAARQPFEDPEFAAVSWSMAKRLAMRVDRGHQLQSYTDMIKGRLEDGITGFSQPIADQWSPTHPSSWCAPGGSRVGTDGCRADRLRRRAQIQSMTDEDIRREYPQLLDAIDAWVKGRLRDPTPDATTFAAWSLRNGFGGVLSPEQPYFRGTAPGNFFGHDRGDVVPRVTLHGAINWAVVGGAVAAAALGIGLIVYSSRRSTNPSRRRRRRRR